MEAAQQAYCAHDCAPLVRHRDGKVFVDLGDGVADTSGWDPKVVRIACGIFESVTTLTPSEAFLYVTRGDFALAADGTDLIERPVLSFPEYVVEDRVLSSSALLPVDLLLSAPRSAHRKHRVHSTALGHPTQTFCMDTLEQATLLYAVYRAHAPLSGHAVRAYLLHAATKTVANVDVLGAPLSATIPRAIPPETSEEVVCGRQRWEALVVDAYVDRLHVHSIAVLIDGRRFAIGCVFVPLHWVFSETSRVFVHRILRDCELRPRETGLGLVLDLWCPSLLKTLEEWPWWLSSAGIVASPALLLPTPCDESNPPSCALESCTMDALTLSYGASTARWFQSHMAVQDTVPRLVKPLELHLASHECFETPCGLRVVRRHVDVHDWTTFMAAELPTEYVDAMIGRSRGSHSVLFCVHNSSTMVAGVALHAYRCYFPDTNEFGSVWHIDGIAVARTNQGQGIGSRILRNVVRKMASEYSQRFIVVAQCLKKGLARRFWMDKLDLTSNAASLLLQALVIDPECHMPSDRDCDTRAREWRV